ncbi:MAG TPA: hypothetical protein VFH73_15120 [Polyangia bacterium]|nr:hypothetical protein [Polyangia bacterium]
MGLRARVIVLGVALVAACGRTTDPPPDGARGDAVRADQASEAPLESAAGREAAPERMCPMECIREVICCRTDCTGPVVSRGCCSCLPGEVDSISCPAQRRCGTI